MGAIGRLMEYSWMSQWVQLDVSMGTVGCLNGCNWTSHGV